MGADDSNPASEGTPLPDESSLRWSELESTFQAALTRTYGAGIDPAVDLPGDSSATTVGARIQKLRAGASAHQRYRLEGEIGRGGMGAVLKIFDTDLRRNLAMKVILAREGQTKGGTAIESRQLLRFLEEAQVTGQLDHPGVVPVHELGVDADDQVYFTMRLVKGQELSKVIEAVHADDPDWNLTRALGVLLKVCEAMSYAHSKGVVHRDLKPANIMVGLHGEVYVMDWGLARVEGHADSLERELPEEQASRTVIQTDRRDAEAQAPDSVLRTLAGQAIGTPYYMPPEQAAGKLAEIGPHSDVYALGAMLYHLVTGRPPYYVPGERLSVHTILARVLDRSPAALHELKPSVPPELESICEKAMARELRARYADMGELAEDLRAYLENRVVQAHRTGAVIEFKKWVRRNRGLAATAAGFVALIVGGSTSAAVVLGAKNEEIRIARDDALDAKDLADEARASSESVTDFLVGQFEALEPEATRGRPVQVSELLDRAALSLEGEMGKSPLESARLCSVVGEAYSSLGRFDQAEPLFVRAHDQRRAVLGEDHPYTLTSLSRLASLCASRGRFEESEALFTRVLQKRRAIFGEDHPATLTSMNNLALVFESQGRFGEAEPLYVKSLAMSRTLLGEDHPDTLTSIGNLGLLFENQGRYAEAEPLLIEALTKRRAVLGADHPDTLGSMDNLAALFESQGRYREAEPLHVQALQLSRTVLGDDHPSTLVSMSNLGVNHWRQGRFEEAEPLLSQALDKAIVALGEDHPTTLGCMGNLALLFEGQGRFEEAEALLLQALQAWRSVRGEDHPSTLTSMSNLAANHASQGRLDEAVSLYSQVRQKSQSALGEDHPITLAALTNLAFQLGNLGRFEEAEPLYVQALEKNRAVFGEEHPTTLGTRESLRQLYLTWLALRRESLGADHPATLATLEGLTRLYAGERRWDEAEARALQLVELTSKRSTELAGRLELLRRIEAQRAD